MSLDALVVERKDPLVVWVTDPLRRIVGAGRIGLFLAGIQSIRLRRSERLGIIEDGAAFTDLVVLLRDSNCWDSNRFVWQYCAVCPSRLADAFAFDLRIARNFSYLTRSDASPTFLPKLTQAQIQKYSIPDRRDASRFARLYLDACVR